MGKKSQKPPKRVQGENNQEENPPKLEIDYQGIYNHQKKLQLLCQNADQSKTIQYFSKVKYKQNIYQIGEFIHLYDPSQLLPYVAKIHAIIRIPSQQIAAILKVQWLLRKTDLPPKFEKIMKHLSVAEVFPSGQFNYVLIESIMRKCYIIESAEYEHLQNAGDNIHFSRAVYEIKKGQLEPPPSQWAKQCYCQCPVNPDLAYIQCEKCEHWFHNQCVRDPKLIEAQKFWCKSCLKK